MRAEANPPTPTSPRWPANAIELDLLTLAIALELKQASVESLVFDLSDKFDKLTRAPILLRQGLFYLDRNANDDSMTVASADVPGKCSPTISYNPRLIAKPTTIVKAHRQLPSTSQKER
ncbi:hypothetical protein ACH79_27445 [Bradyrhizobium sp. CCBAU 051011]|nr:hypothetical protein ACH79_27445 [Bradyrhizobium sp. CCBAU 051011]